MYAGDAVKLDTGSWPPQRDEQGLEFWVNGSPRRLVSLGLTGCEPGTLPVWTASVDGHLGCGGTLDAALILAARAAEIAKG